MDLISEAIRDMEQTNWIQEISCLENHLENERYKYGAVQKTTAGSTV